MKRLFPIAFMASMLCSMPLMAVQNYQCDFENQADRDRWVLNPAANTTIYNQLANKWYIGEPGNNAKTGSYGLYISDDNGATATYANKGCWVFAYDTVALDHLSTQDDYTIIFDYAGMGNIASNFDGIYLLWIPMVDPDSGDSIKIGSIATSSGIPDVYDNYIISLQPNAMIDFVGGSQTWKQCVATLPNKKCDGKTHYLAFVWANTSNQAQQPGGMVDNIAIMDTRPCDAPTGLKLEIKGTTSNLSWTGTTDEYEVAAYSYETETWYGPKIVSGTATSFASLPIGQTDFIVRAKCAEGLFSLKTTISNLVYYPDQMCVDYLNLDNAKCYTGTGFNNTTTFSNYVEGPAVNNGPASPESRHTIHFDKNEREPRSNGKLSTIPNGELASVRLGNWKNGNETERIEYSFMVDTLNFPVLLLKYAPILEAPNHKDTENPRFTLDMLIGNSSIGECGRADFNANNVLMKEDGKTVLRPEAEKQGWHITPKELAQANGADVIWKEWTTVGVNLKKPEYQGKKLTVRLSTYDCAMVQHCGYAYFTLGCSDGKLKGMKCGEVNPVFEAPDGFVYSWSYAYNEKFRDPVTKIMPEKYVLGHEQRYEAGLKDDSTYVVDCMFVQDSTCFFSLYASTLATNPIAVMEKPVVTKSCATGKYHLKLDASNSWVQEIDHVTADTNVSKIHHIDRYEWNIEGLPNAWSDQPKAEFDLPSSGGKYMISLKVSSGICDSTIYYPLVLDELKETRDTLNVVLCDDVKKQGYKWKEKSDTTYFDYSTDSVVLFSTATSCDSIIYLILTEPVRVKVDTLVLPENLPLAYRGRSYSENIVDTIPVSDSNCDTTWILNFEVYESLLASMPDSAYILCEGDPVLKLVYDISRGRSLRYSYSFEDTSLPAAKTAELQRKGHYEFSVAIDPKLYPNVYKGKLILEDSLPQWNVTIPFTLTMQYASTVIAQRWNDVLAVRNTEYNGGYVFDSVQWYVGNEPIEQAMDFNYYTGEGKTLRFGEEYRALLKRNDGVWLFTCAYVPVKVDEKITDLPSLVPPSSQIYVKGRGTAIWYDLSGRPLSKQAYDASSVIAPAATGCYLLVLNEDSSRSVRRMIVR